MALTKVTSGLTDLDGGITIDNITIDGTTISQAGSSDLTIDVGGRIDLSADDNGEVRLFDGSSMYAQFKDDSDNFVIQSLISDADLQLVVNDGGSVVTALTIDSSVGGNVGIGTTSPTGKLEIAATGTQAAPHIKLVESGDTREFNIFNDGAGNGHLALADNDDDTPDTEIVLNDNGVITMNTVDVERMRISSAGTILVGKTAEDTATDGIELNRNDVIVATRDGDSPLLLNRKSSDGDIINLRKDNANVGSIGVSGSNNIYISGSQTNHCGLTFATNAILPTTQGSTNDNTVDLGASSERFGNIFAGNGTIQTSDRNEKQDEDNITDAEKRVAVAAKGLLKKFKFKDAVTEKGSDARIHFGIIAQDLQDAFSAEGLDASDYGMWCSDTWTDEVTGESKTRLGVRYSELLAFILIGI